MTLSQSRRSLVNSKYQLSLRLFYFERNLSGVLGNKSALFCSAVIFPLLAIFTLSTGLLLWHWQKSTRKINIPVVSAIFGILWPRKSPQNFR